MLPLDRAASFALGFVVMVVVVVMAVVDRLGGRVNRGNRVVVGVVMGVVAVVERLGGGVDRVVMVVMMVAVMMPTVHRGGAGNHAVVERFHTRTDAAGDRPFLTTGRTHESEQRLQERHTRNLLAPVATGKGSET